MSKVTLVIIFNHQYNKNIAPLKQLYNTRFSRIHFLIPFYEGSDKDITPVYENSYYFQGYIAQGFKNFYHEESAHYLFVADDMILNPAINEDNYAEHFQLQQDESFIPEIFELHNLTNNDTLLFEDNLTIKAGVRKKFWIRIKDIYDYTPHKRGVETSNNIPSPEKAKQIIAQHGYTIKPLTYWDIYGSLDPQQKSRNKVGKLWRILRYGGNITKKFRLNYPLVASYSDIVIVDKKAIRQFAQYCGVFAATELFVEAAIPTALLLASNKVKTEPAIGKRGILYWNYSKQQNTSYENDMQQYQYELQQLLQRFPADKLYMHPIKLSKWKTDLP